MNDTFETWLRSQDKAHSAIASEASSNANDMRDSDEYRLAAAHDEIASVHNDRARVLRHVLSVYLAMRNTE